MRARWRVNSQVKKKHKNSRDQKIAKITKRDRCLEPRKAEGCDGEGSGGVGGKVCMYVCVWVDMRGGIVSRQVREAAQGRVLVGRRRRRRREREGERE